MKNIYKVLGLVVACVSGIYGMEQDRLDSALQSHIAIYVSRLNSRKPARPPQYGRDRSVEENAARRSRIVDLLNKCANPRTKNNEGKSPLDFVPELYLDPELQEDLRLAADDWKKFNQEEYERQSFVETMEKMRRANEQEEAAIAQQKEAEWAAMCRDVVPKIEALLKELIPSSTTPVIKPVPQYQPTKRLRAAPTRTSLTTQALS